MAHRLACHLLGAFGVVADGVTVEDAAWRRNRARALVKLLALARGHRLHREQLYDTLWPELDGDAAAANLRKALHYARRALAPEHIVVRGPLVSLKAAELWVDVDAFDQAVDQGDLASAIALYTEDLLPEDRFEPWTEPRREQLRLRHGRVLLDWARELAGRGDLRTSTSTLERLVELDPLHEEAHADLIRVLTRSGQHRLAEQAYDRLARRLRTELGVAPGRAVRQAREAMPDSRQRVAPPRAAGAPAQAALAEERRLVAVVALAGADPAAAGEVLRASSTAMLCDHAGGLLAVFGVPAVGEYDTPDALRAALELARRLPGTVRVGVETGEAVIGTGPARAVAGGPVDVAIQLRDAAPPGGVLAGPAAYRLARGVFSFGPARSGAVRARPLRGVATTTTGRHPPRSRFVGRSGELDALVSLCTDAAAAGRPRLVTVVGPAGVGKSRLVAEAVARIAPGTTVLRGRCLPRGQAGGYAALGDLLREAVGPSLRRGARTARSRVHDGLAGLLVPLGLPAELHRITMAALAVTIGLPVVGDNPLDGLKPAEVAEEMGHAWPRFATACGRSGPVLFIVEDLHWAAPELLEMLERMLGRCSGPVVLIGTARPEVLEAHPAYGSRGEGSALISLPPLTEADGLRLLAGLREAWASGVPDELAAEALARAGGNPFFLEELVAHIADGASAGGLPYSLHAVIAARVDALPPLERRVLQEASVVGRTFWRPPVERGLDLPDVVRPLQALEARGLILARPSSSLAGQAEYAFKHALVREVAYASLTRARRARAHAAVGSWLKDVAGDRHEELAELLAYHYRQAADPRHAELVWDNPAERERVRRRAFAHLLAAGSAARRRFALARAIDLHAAALGLAATVDERLQALEILGDDHGFAFRGEESSRYLHEALGTVRRDPARADERARLCWKLAWQMAMTPGAYRSSPDPLEAEDLISEGLAAAPDDLSRARLLMTRASCARLWKGSEPFGQGDRFDPTPVELRIRAADEAMAIATAAGDEDLARAGRSTLGVLYGIAGRYAEMLEMAYLELSTVDQIRSRLEQADVLRMMAVLAGTVAGRFTESLEFARRSYALCQDSTPHQVIHATCPILAALFQLGRWDEMDEVLDVHLRALARERDHSCQLVRDGPVIAATALAYRGDLARAAELVGLVGEPRGGADNASAYYARYATAAGDPATARLVSATKAAEGRMYGPQHALALVEAMEAQEDWAALEAFLPVARAQRAGNALVEPFCDRAEGLAHAARGRPDAARECLSRAVARFERMAVPFEAARTREAAERAGR